MDNTMKSNKTGQEEAAMRKLIVEAPELKEGQKYSSGGIRECKNGRMSVEYKNPVPYEEPKSSLVSKKIRYTEKDVLKSKAKDVVINIGREALLMFWDECGKPFIRARLHQLSQKIIVSLEEPSKPLATMPSHEGIDLKVKNIEYEEFSETADVDDHGKIIRFPNRRIS